MLNNMEPHSAKCAVEYDEVHLVCRNMAVTGGGPG
jgi:hypothetical protein